MASPRVLCVITARGGSKRVPGKNICPLAGKPLIAWTIEAARACKELQQIVVSTDDETIAKVSREYGADVPFLRPPELSSDEAKSLPVIQHATAFIEKREGIKFDWVLTLQPTSPFRTAEDIRTALTLAESAPYHSVVSVKPIPVHPIFAKKIDGDGLLQPFVMEEPEGLRRQDVSPPAYCRNGAIYLTRREVLMEQNTLYGKRIGALVMPEERSVDIDSPLDFMVAEQLLLANKKAA